MSSGAIHSPAHLLRAGIGPAGHLRDLGIEVRAHLPGVGQRLMDHPSVAVSSFMKPQARINGLDPAAHPAGAALFVRLDGIAPGDMFRRGGQQIGLARGRRADRVFMICVYKTCPRPGRCGSPRRDWRAEPMSSSTYCRTGATSSD